MKQVGRLVGSGRGRLPGFVMVTVAIATLIQGMVGVAVVFGVIGVVFLGGGKARDRP
jgi:hypothetical protein